MYITHQKGRIAELKIEEEAIARGYTVSRPTVESRYDLILDDGASLHRVQVKYVDQYKNGAYDIDLRSECRNNGYSRTYEEHEIDLFMVYLSTHDTIVCFEASDFALTKHISIRVEPTKNKQTKGVRMINDYKW